MFEAAQTVIHANPLVITFIIGTIIPFLVALVTKATVSNTVRSLLTMALSAASAVVVQIQANGNSFVLESTVVLFFTTFGTSVLTYLGFWRPVAKVNSNLWPDHGLG